MRAFLKTLVMVLALLGASSWAKTNENSAYPSRSAPLSTQITCQAEEGAAHCAGDAAGAMQKTSHFTPSTASSTASSSASEAFRGDRTFLTTPPAEPNAWLLLLCGLLIGGFIARLRLGSVDK